MRTVTEISTMPSHGKADGTTAMRRLRYLAATLVFRARPFAYIAAAPAAGPKDSPSEIL